MAKPLAAKYLNLLGSRKSSESGTFQEKAIVHVPPELSDHLGRELLEKTHSRLSLEYEKRGINDEGHKVLIQDTLAQGRESLAVIGNEDPYMELTDEQAVALEAIVIANGTRPSIKVDDMDSDEGLDFGEWETSFSDFSEQIIQLSKSVGRMDKSGSHCGTGFVVAPELIMTNRHVLLAMAEEGADGGWNFNGSNTINFDNKQFEVMPEVVFSGSGDVAEGVNFGNIDMAILRCKNTGDSFPPPLKFKVRESDIMKGRYAYILGYPGKPNPGYENFIVLRKLFNFEFGVKRISPGEISAAIGELDGDIHGRIFEHDCTTLGGNSGSPVVDFDETGLGVFGLHFAGAKRVGNFAHATAVFRDKLEDLGLTFE